MSKCEESQPPVCSPSSQYSFSSDSSSTSFSSLKGLVIASSVTPTRGIGVDRSSAKIVSKTVASFSHVTVGSISKVGSQRNLHGDVCAATGAAVSTREASAIAYFIGILCRYWTLQGDTPVQFFRCSFAHSFVWDV